MANTKNSLIPIYLQVEDVEAYHGTIAKKRATITEGLTTQWWGDRTFKVRDPNGYDLWFYQTVGQPQPPEGTKVV